MAEAEKGWIVTHEAIAAAGDSPDGCTMRTISENCRNSCCSETEVFEWVLVCNGHYERPFPNDNELELIAPHLSKFTGDILHSKYYDTPVGDPRFVGKRVLVVGAGSSGDDIAREASFVAKEVHVSDRKAIASERLPDSNIWRRPPIRSIVEPQSVIFSDSLGRVGPGSAELEEFDCIVLCTGFCYDFPFLSCGVLCDTNGNQGSTELKPTPPLIEMGNNNNCVKTLYKHLIHARFPSLAFVGIPLMYEGKYVCINNIGGYAY